MLRKLVLKYAPKAIYPCLVWWVWWSRLYRLLFHRKYSDSVILILPLWEVGSRLRKLTWTKDSVTELWDSCGSPKWVQHCVDVIQAGGAQPKGALDCDDSSVWAAHALSSMYSPRLLTVIWRTKSGKVAGHAMCLCTAPDKTLFHVGNWGVIADIVDLRDACTDLAERVDADAILGWGILTKDLTIVHSGQGLPEPGYDGSIL